MRLVQLDIASGYVSFSSSARVCCNFQLGGRYVFDLAFEDVIKVAVVSHPSRLEIPDDLKASCSQNFWLEKYTFLICLGPVFSKQKYASTVTAPLLINSCEVDSRFPKEAQEMADEILGGGKFTPGYKREYFEGCTHGFAVRGDLSDPKVKAGKEGSFKAAAEWFLKYL